MRDSWKQSGRLSDSGDASSYSSAVCIDEVTIKNGKEVPTGSSIQIDPDRVPIE
mgnify:CR=1 FL=1